MRQQYERINQSIFNSSLFSSFVCGSSPQTKWRTLRQRLDMVMMVKQQKVAAKEQPVSESSAVVKVACNQAAGACEVEGKRHVLMQGYQVTDDWENLESVKVGRCLPSARTRPERTGVTPHSFGPVTARK